ncbi:hypothetical protein BaRGS_00021852 [Batillaria attramentaria]|uniref:Uncharacterized protein n=1 Tax=Batillaria attramentaria TaxID=370345 RepID=A0ABD0KI41_9CAEN
MINPRNCPPHPILIPMNLELTIHWRAMKRPKFDSTMKQLAPSREHPPLTMRPRLGDKICSRSIAIIGLDGQKMIKMGGHRQNRKCPLSLVMTARRSCVTLLGFRVIGLKES